MRPSFVLACLLLSSCSALDLELGEPMDKQALASLVTEPSNLGDVLEALGAPYAIETHSEGYALIYEHLHLDESQLGISSKVPLLEVFKFVYGNSDANHEATVVVLDHEGVVSGIVSNSWPEDVGSALGLQFFFQVNSVVGSKGLTDKHESLDWGSRLLLRLPSAQNLPHRADLAQRGQHLRAGQLTLEQRPWPN